MKRLLFLVILTVLLCTGGGARAIGVTFTSGDVFVSLENGTVQWRSADGILTRMLVPTVAGTGEGLGFDPAGNLYVTRWCVDPVCAYSGNTVEKFNTLGQSEGRVGSGYNCSPHAIVFDPTGRAYVGQAGCSGAILKFAPGMTMPVAYPVAPEYQGSFWVELAPDQCRVLYTSYGPHIKQADLCAGVQLPDFNTTPVPGGVAHDLRILPDGGVIVSTGDVISRMNASGMLIGTYGLSGEAAVWAGLDLVGDGSFWVANYETSNIYHFDLATGSILGRFNTGTSPHTAVGVRVKK